MVEQTNEKHGIQFEIVTFEEFLNQTLNGGCPIVFDFVSRSGQNTPTAKVVQIVLDVLFLASAAQLDCSIEKF